jgi:hypothetical protein
MQKNSVKSQLDMSIFMFSQHLRGWLLLWGYEESWVETLLRYVQRNG